MRSRRRSGRRRRVPAGSVRSTAVASPVEVPVREASAASASSRSSSSVCASGWRCARSLSVIRSRTAASRAETSGRMTWTSGRSSRTCFIATETWFSPWNGTSPTSIS